jgi:hypothetical protein
MTVGSTDVQWIPRIERDFTPCRLGDSEPGRPLTPLLTACLHAIFGSKKSRLAGSVQYVSGPIYGVHVHVELKLHGTASIGGAIRGPTGINVATPTGIAESTRSLATLGLVGDALYR